MSAALLQFNLDFFIICFLRCVCRLDIIVTLFFPHFFQLVNLVNFGIADARSGYIVSVTPPETLQLLCLWSENLHMACNLSLLHFCLFSACEFYHILK